MKYSLLLIFLIVTTQYSCIKVEGLGGNATIQGKVYVLDYNMELTNKLDEYYGSDIDVFIIYGDDSIYNDDFKTSYDGSYRFEYLRPGNYRIFAYSEDTTGLTEGNTFPVFKNIEIDEKDQIVNVDDIVIVK